LQFLLDSAGPRADMAAINQEIAAHNATAAPDDRIICRREQLTGSHRKTKVCMTVGQRRSLMEQTQEGLASSGRNGAGNLNGLEPGGG
jgi:hypothetical protein